MFLNLGHVKLEVYGVIRKFVVESYKITQSFPHDERFNMTQQIRRAALSVQLNLAEGASRKSLSERLRFYEIARSSLVEVDSAFDAAHDLGYIDLEKVKFVGEHTLNAFKMIKNMINSGRN